MSVNKVILLGRLGQEPELKYTPGSSAVCNFTLATTENWTDKKGQKQEKTEWHKVVVWGKLAEICNMHLKKGKQAYVEGRLQTRSWDDKNDVKRYITEINAFTVQFVGGYEKNKNNETLDDIKNKAYSSQEMTIENDNKFTADEIPF